MINTIDTNIFIYSIYDNECNKAIKKFLNDKDRGPIPCYLHNEIYNKLVSLIWLFKNSIHSLEKGKRIDQISEFQELKQDFSNVYDYLSNSSSNFSEIKRLLEILKSRTQYTDTLATWLDEIKYYPNNEQEEKGIMNKYKDKKNNLLKFEELHNADLKIVVIFYHYCSRKVMTKGRLVTEDKKLMKRKNEIEKEFDFVKLIRVEEYLK